MPPSSPFAFNSPSIRAAVDEMVRQHHQLNGYEFEQTLGDREGQRSLVCCSPWGCKESGTAKPLNNNNDLL